MPRKHLRRAQRWRVRGAARDVRWATFSCALSFARRPSSCLRTFEGLGGQHVHIVESLELLRPSSAVTKSCDRWLTIHHHHSVVDCIDALKQDGFTVVATHLSDSAVPLDDLPMQTLGKIAVLFGKCVALVCSCEREVGRAGVSPLRPGAR